MAEASVKIPVVSHVDMDEGEEVVSDQSMGSGSGSSEEEEELPPQELEAGCSS
jgi:hypothetical protein